MTAAHTKMVIILTRGVATVKRSTIEVEGDVALQIFFIFRPWMLHPYFRFRSVICVVAFFSVDSARVMKCVIFFFFSRFLFLSFFPTVMIRPWGRLFRWKPGAGTALTQPFSLRWWWWGERYALGEVCKTIKAWEFPAIHYDQNLNWLQERSPEFISVDQGGGDVCSMWTAWIPLPPLSTRVNHY